MTNRLFVALDIPGDIKDQIISIRNNLYQSSENVKWEKREKYHFTIKFLGDVEESKNEVIINTLADQLKDQKKIYCEFNKFGCFNKSGQPKILWLALKFNEKLKLLANQVDLSLSNLGFPTGANKGRHSGNLLNIVSRCASPHVKNIAVCSRTSLLILSS